MRKATTLALCLMAYSMHASACWQEAGARYGVDPQLLCGIGKVESHFQPRAVNRSHLHRTKSVDVGEMQVNSSWLNKLSKYGLTVNDLFDSCVSRNIGAWIISDLFTRMGKSWEAVGAYKASCSTLSPQECQASRREYAWQVYRAMQSADCRPEKLS